MKKSRFSETQIVSILKQYDQGATAADLCREHGISSATLYNWKSKYGGLESSQLKRIKELEEENNKLKHMFADVSIQRDALKFLIEKKL
jgi:putative transposase